MKGYKVFNPDWTCNSFQYEVGKEFTHEGEIKPCQSGFHFCQKLVDCFNYYDFEPTNKVAEVEAHGTIIDHGDKSVTNRIRIEREITWHEALEMVNLGKGNTGHSNSGNRNSGNRNSGNRNSGNSNSGNRNSGNWNSCNFSTGDFCSKEPEFLLFNQISPMSRDEFHSSHAYWICRQLRVVDVDGNKIDYKEAWSNLWDGLSNDEKICVQSMPNFDADVFKDITGISAWSARGGNS